MKIVKINDNIKINIEQIYSLQYSDNKKDIDNWNEKYNQYLNKFTEDPITLQISDDKVFTPNFHKENNAEDLKLYSIALNNHIISIIGKCPKFVQNYSLILSTGLKVNITKEIYDKVNEIFDQYLIQENKDILNTTKE